MDESRTGSPVIYIVDDDPAVCDALSVIFDMEGFDPRTFTNGEAFLAAAETQEAGCVLLDVHMPGRSGIDILERLRKQRYGAPIFIISGQADIPLAVTSIKRGAHDFIEKPFDADSVVQRVRDALEAAGGGIDGPLPGDFNGAEQLTPREHEVLRAVISGASNKEAGRQLGISPRTIEVHRARIMDKLGARNAADLVRIVLGGG